MSANDRMHLDYLWYEYFAEFNSPSFNEKFAKIKITIGSCCLSYTKTRYLLPKLRWNFKSNEWKY